MQRVRRPRVLALVDRLLLACTVAGVIAAGACVQGTPQVTKTATATPASARAGAIAPSAKVVPAPPSVVASASASPSASVALVAPVAAPLDPRVEVRAYLAKRLPQGGAVVDRDGETAITHTTQTKLTPLEIAGLYLDATTAYTAGELADAIGKPLHKGRRDPIAEGVTLDIPRVLQVVPKSPSQGRLGWPEDKALRGIYLSGPMAAEEGFPRQLDTVVARGMNTVVVDAKDVTGLLSYPSEVPIAVSSGATKSASLPSFSRMIRVAHEHGVRVIARVSCFRDEHLAPRRPELALQRRGGGPHHGPRGGIDWLDPTNDEVQGYLLGIVDEAIAAGADEIQLDYVRYPTEGVGDADFHLSEKKMTTADAITAWVHRVHEHTQKGGVPLSLDVFGIVAWRFDADVGSTGQDLARLGAEIEAVSPMVYPSHFADGFNGWAIPGGHAEIVGIGTARAIDVLKQSGSKAVVRSWVQAFPYKSPGFGTEYIAAQMTSAEHVGGVGWLAWNSGGEYGATYAASPIAEKRREK